MLAFIRRVKASTPPDAGPIVIHCRWGRWRAQGEGPRCGELGWSRVGPRSLRSPGLGLPCLETDDRRECFKDPKSFGSEVGTPQSLFTRAEESWSLQAQSLWLILTPLQGLFPTHQMPHGCLLSCGLLALSLSALLVIFLPSSSSLDGCQTTEHAGLRGGLLMAVRPQSMLVSEGVCCPAKSKCS